MSTYLPPTRYFLVVAILFLRASLCAQPAPARIDSFQNALQTAPDPATRLRVLDDFFTLLWRFDPVKAKQLAYQYLAEAQTAGDAHHIAQAYVDLSILVSTPDSIQFFAEKVIAMADKNPGDEFLQNLAASAYQNIGVAYGQAAKMDEAMKFFKLAEQKATRETDKVIAWNNIGNVHSMQGQYPEALEYFQKVRDFALKTGKREAEAKSLSNIGAIYRELGDLPKAIEFQEKALVLSEQIGDSEAAVGCHYSLAMIFMENDSTLPKAIFHLETLLKKNERLGDPTYSALAMASLTECCLKTGQPEKAANYAAQAVEITKDLPDEDYYKGQSLLAMAMVLNEKGDFQKALQLARQARQGFENSGEDENDDTVEMLEELAHAQIGTGNLAEGWKTLQRYQNLKAQMSTENIKKEVANAEAQFRVKEHEFAAREAKRETEKTATQRNWSLILLAGLAFFLVFGFFAYKKQRQLRQLAQQQQQRIEAQNEELLSLERLKSRFFANMSHELRTPLTLMLGPLNSLQGFSNSRSEKENKLLQFVERNTKHLLNLVNEILDLSKLEKGKLEIRETAVNFQAFLKPIVAQFSSAGDSESLKFRLDFQPDSALNLFLDTSKFEKIVHNFFSNAVKFTPAGGKIQVTVREVETDLEISVADEGIGIHPDDLPHVFDRFYQSKRDDALAQSGTGIGLSLASELAELLGGKVWVKSVWGTGSTFFYRFPKKIAPAEAVLDLEKTVSTAIENLGWAEKEPENSGEAIGGFSLSGVSKPSVLVVEDNPELREYLQILLEDEYEITTAENGKVAWDWLSENPGSRPDLIVSDLMMPVMDGFAFLEKVKNHDALRHLPTIMLTARADVKVKIRALRIGIDDYLTKPFVEEELKIRVRNLLENSRQRALAASEIAAPEDETVFQKNEIASPEKSLGERPIISAADAAWLADAEKVFEKYLAETQFNMEWAAHELAISSRQLDRRLKQLTGLTASQYHREMRLQTARDWLHEGRFSTIKETAFAVGFLDVKHFSRLFQERFGVLPSAYFH